MPDTNAMQGLVALVGRVLVGYWRQSTRYAHRMTGTLIGKAQFKALSRDEQKSYRAEWVVAITPPVAVGDAVLVVSDKGEVSLVTLTKPIGSRSDGMQVWEYQKLSPTTGEPLVRKSGGTSTDLF